jgi:hypothetical protein
VALSFGGDEATDTAIAGWPVACGCIGLEDTVGTASGASCTLLATFPIWFRLIFERLKLAARSPHLVKISYSCPATRQRCRRSLELPTVFADHLEEEPSVKKRFEYGSRRLEPMLVVLPLEGLASPRTNHLLEPFVQGRGRRQRERPGRASR